MPSLLFQRSQDATIIVVVLAESTVGVVAQDESGPEPLVAVTGTGECQQVADGLTEYDENGVEHFRGYATRCTLTMGDERLDDPYIFTLNTDCYADGGCTQWGTTETEGPDGWRGTYRGWSRGGGYPALVGVAKGFGAYEGLTYVYGYDSSGTVDGVIYEGPPPPWDVAVPE